MQIGESDMDRIRFERAENINARPDTIWDIIADYRSGHPLILPKAFGPLTVEAGGIGAGTVISFTFRIMGVTRHVRHTVSTPEPGRVLVESDAASATTFTITPLDEGRAARVQIATEMDAPRGLMGVIWRLMLPPTRRQMDGIYREELSVLAAVAVRREGAPSAQDSRPQKQMA
jgi:hypothetical protein